MQSKSRDGRTNLLRMAPWQSIVIGHTIVWSPKFVLSSYYVYSEEDFQNARYMQPSPLRTIQVPLQQRSRLQEPYVYMILQSQS